MGEDNRREVSKHWLTLENTKSLASRPHSPKGQQTLAGLSSKHLGVLSVSFRCCPGGSWLTQWPRYLRHPSTIQPNSSSECTDVRAWTSCTRQHHNQRKSMQTYQRALSTSSWWFPSWLAERHPAFAVHYTDALVQQLCMDLALGLLPG
jgi:hypothetical protein